MSDPLTEIEVLKGMRDLAAATRAFYVELVEQGFVPHEALKLVGSYLAGLAGGASQ